MDDALDPHETGMMDQIAGRWWEYLYYVHRSVLCMVVVMMLHHDGF